MGQKMMFFLPGKGKKLEEYEGLPEHIAQSFGAEFIPLRAPYPHPKPEKAAQGRRTWFNKFVNEKENGREDADIEEYMDSLHYIEDEINQRLQAGVDPKDILILGHSMGAGLAVHVGLEMKLGSVIAVAADMPYNLQYQVYSNTPIYWFECKNDTVLKDPRRKQSYHLVKDQSNFHYGILPNSTHDDFGPDLLTAVKEIRSQGKGENTPSLASIVGKER